MKTFLTLALAATLGTGVVAAAPADARDGCGPGFHRTPRGACIGNRIGGYYANRGYWDGRRYWHHRERWHGGWRYR